MIRRRQFLKGGLAAGAALSFGPAFWRDTFQAMAANRTGAGPYGPLGPPDANGIRLPKGFRSRVIAQAGQPVPGTGYTWPVFPDGSASFPAPAGYVVVVNTENPPDIGIALPNRPGGASAVRFLDDGEIVGAYRILSGTNTNCSGGPTPWSTWLSCEEIDDGQVWECDPLGVAAAKAHPAMGRFPHEAAAVDPVGRRVYLSEDDRAGGFYRYTPTAWPDLSSGTLEVASVANDASVSWLAVPDPAARSRPTRQQVPAMTKFQRGEGLWLDSGIVYLATTADNKVHAYNTVFETIELLYDGAKLTGTPLTNVDNVTASPSGDVFVCEDSGGSDPLDICLITGDGEVSRFLKVTGVQHTGAGADVSSELTGVTFDPSGTRMYFSSQRGFGLGVTYEVTGPFQQARRVPRKPRLRVDAPSALRLGTLARKGLPVRVTADAPCEITVALRATLPRKGSKRRRRVTIARVKGKLDAGGTLTLSPKTGRRSRSLLRGRRKRVRALLDVQAVTPAGTRAAESRVVSLRPSKRP